MQWFSDLARAPLTSKGVSFVIVTKDKQDARLFYLAPDDNVYVHDGNFVLVPLSFYLLSPEDYTTLAKLDPQVQSIRIIPQPEPALPSIMLVHKYVPHIRPWVREALVNALTH